jgi:PncC family amidohydrolase
MANTVDGIELASQVGQYLARLDLTVATAESCTGGLIADHLTDIPGSSRYFLGGVVAYSNGAKRQLLHVDGETLNAYGAVSSQVAAEMAQGVRLLLSTDLGVAVTGIAGPGGATAEKPVGLVYVALADEEQALVERHVWAGARRQNKVQSAGAALRLLCRYLEHQVGSRGV